MTAQEQKQVEGMKAVIEAKGAPARASAEKQQAYLEREIKAMKSLNEDYNDARQIKFESQLNVINEALK